MITKTQQVDAGYGLPEKKKKKKKSLKEDCSTGVSPRRATSPCKKVVQAPEVPLVKKKKKKKQLLTEDHLEPETVFQARQEDRSLSSRKRVTGLAELHRGEKRKKRKSLSAVSVPPDPGVETSLSARQGREGTRVGKKLKKHKKEKRAKDSGVFPAQNPWLYEAGDAVCPCALRRASEALVISGQKWKQGSHREHSVKVKKKKKIHLEGDLSLNPLGASMPVRNSIRKGGEKKPAKHKVPEYMAVGEGPRTPVKKKTRSKKQAEAPGFEEMVLKKKKKKKKKERESQVISREVHEEEPDTDLEVVLEKKGNMDEAHIDKVRRKALQEEIDRESGKTEAPEPKKWTGTQFGQWDTAGFETEDQKLKFLKLMGGFKNLSPSFSHPPSVRPRPNMALDKAAACTLRQNLQEDYDRAMSWKYSRGAGLGFPRTPNKVFYIDRTASKSIKFED
ncbi:lysine-rich nucleolar protein 1 [Rhynchocyon petersi]